MAPTFTKFEPFKFLSFWLYERLNQEKVPASINQINELVKEIIESIPAVILQRVIEEFSRRIRNYIVARRGISEKEINTCIKTLKSRLSVSSCFIHLPSIS